MKVFSLVFMTLILSVTVKSRVLLNRHKRHSSRPNLYTRYPRYLVPNRMQDLTEDPVPESGRPADKLRLDKATPKERELFMMTDYEAQKKRFGQRMKCK